MLCQGEGSITGVLIIMEVTNFYYSPIITSETNTINETSLTSLWNLLRITSCVEKSTTFQYIKEPGADSIKRCHLTSIGNPIVKIRRFYDRLISTMGFPILVRWHFYIESGPMLFHGCDKLVAAAMHIEAHGRLKRDFPAPRSQYMWLNKSLNAYVGLLAEPYPKQIEC